MTQNDNLAILLSHPQLRELFMSDKCKYYKRSDTGKYVVSLSWKGRRYTRSHYDDRFALIRKDMAQVICSAINHDIDEKGDLFDPKLWFSAERDLQFSYAIDKWYETKDYAPGAVRDIENSLSLAKNFFKNSKIKTIRKAHLKRFLETLTQGPATKQKIMNHLKSGLNEICDDWHLMRMPFPTISIPYKEQPWYTREAQDRIIPHISESDQPIFRLLQAHGCRPSEACALMWDAVDFDAEWIIFKRTFSGDRHLRPTTKTGYHRKVPMNEDIIELLKPIRGIGESWVFRNRIGNHYQRGPLGKLWAQAQRDVGLDPISLKNGFRHSKISQLKQDGYDTKLISEFIGHRRLKTTEGYMHIDYRSMMKMVG